MNRKTAILTATFVVFGLSACTPAEVKQFLAATRKPTPTPTVLDTRPTVATPLPRNEATVTTYIIDIGTPAFPVINPNAPCGETGGGDCPQPTIPCGETGGLDCAQPPTPSTTVYTGPPLMQCDDGSFAEQGQCPAPNDQQAPASAP